MMYSPMRRRRRRGRAPTALGFSGGLALLGGTYLGMYAANTLHRWSVTYAAGATNAPALPAGVSDLQGYNNLAVLARPTWQSQLWQWGFAVAAGFVGLAMPWRIGRLLAFGTSLGAAAHAGFQLITGYIILPLVKGGTFGQRAYAVELQANYTLGKMTPPTTSASTTQGLGQPPGQPVRRVPPPIRALPQNQPARVPTALATGAAQRQPAPAHRAPFPAGTAAALGQAPSPGDFVGSGNGPPPVTVPNLPNGNCPDGSTAVTNPSNLDMPFCVPTNTPATPPPTPPPATPPPTPPATPACPLPWGSPPAGCCGNNPCSCGAQQGSGIPGTVLGQPPVAGPAHPLFGMMMLPRQRRAA